jgi:hypothetical protein
MEQRPGYILLGKLEEKSQLPITKNTLSDVKYLGSNERKCKSARYRIRKTTIVTGY